MSRKMYGYSVLLASSVLALSLAGCGTDKKEGVANGGGVAKVDEALCAQCHSASVETLSGANIYTDYQASVHALNSVGCQDCHGGGAQHNGVGPIPYPKPNHLQCKTCHDSAGLVTAYEGSKHYLIQTEDGEAVCNRCHTHQGAVLAAKFGFTGDRDTLDAKEAAGLAPGALATGTAEPIKCNTCHVTHKPNELRVDAGWAPSTTVGAAVPSTNDQYRLCTQCHTYINPAGVLTGSGSTASGTVKVGHHETSWYRIIASTHYDNPATQDIEGYGVRTTGTNPCFDCHGHESLTNTNSGDATIYTDWAASGHAGGLLTAKKAAAATVTIPAGSRTDPARVAAQLAQVDAVMVAVADIPIEEGASCVRCHTSTGLVQFLATPAAGGSVTFDAGTGTATTVASTLTGLANGELTMCWGCHSNAAKGTLRTLAGTKSTTNYTTDLGHTPTGYALYDGKKVFPDVAGSNLCISCHDGRNSNPASVVNVTPAVTTPAGTHYMPAAGVMYVKTGFINFSTGTTYLNSLKADLDGGGITSTHRKLGTPAMIGDHGITAADTALLSNGPCVACHISASHTLKIDQKAITAVCIKCHDSEGGHSILTKTAFDTYFLEPQKEVYVDAITLAVDIFNSRQSTISIVAASDGVFRRYYQFGTTTTATAANWTTVATALGMDPVKLLGAISNVTMFSKDKAGFAHARTYSRRLLYDCIDYLDDGSMNQTVGATAIARSLLPAPVAPAVSDSTHSIVSGAYTKGTTAFDSTLTTLGTGTSEAMTFLLKWDRSGANAGGWNATSQRP